MKRKDFLKSAGLAGVGLFGLKKLAAASPTSGLPNLPGDPEKINLLTCTVTPTETAGPYPWVSGTNINNSVFWRSNILEPGTAGSGVGCVPLTVKLRVINVANCTPIANARVDLWHCSDQGVYSGYGAGAGATWMRGIQQTDSQGYVTFQTIFPGWYTGRIQHIHYQVYVSGVLKLTSQLAFPETLMNQINGIAPYSSIPGKPPYGPGGSFAGANSIATNSADGIFSDGTTGELLTMTGDVNTGLVGSLDVVISYAAAASAGVDNFNGGVNNGRAMLWWSASQREAFSHFLVEKSTDWEDWTPIARIEGKGKIGLTEHYSFLENARLDGHAQYRLTIVDKENNSDSTVYLPLRATAKTVQLTTNPANEHLVVKHPEMRSGEAAFHVLGADGSQLLHGVIQFGATASLIDVRSLAKGDYFLAYDDGTRLEVLPFSKN